MKSSSSSTLFKGVVGTDEPEELGVEGVAGVPIVRQGEPLGLSEGVLAGVVGLELAGVLPGANFDGVEGGSAEPSPSAVSPLR